MSSAIDKALRALAAGELSVPVDAALPLDQIGQAFERIGGREVLGKLVLDTRGG
jgi:NADPH:quinone reductase-like Zn-dependent oxidoreductase